MNRVFASKLAEQVASMFITAFLATYGTGLIWPGTEVSHAAVTQRAIIAGVAGVIQLLLGVLVGPHVGDPNSPSLLPTSLLRRMGVPVTTQQQLVVGIDDVIQATIRELALKFPGALDLQPSDVAREVVAAAAQKAAVK